MNLLKYTLIYFYFLLSLRSETINVFLPKDFDQSTLNEYEVVWGSLNSSEFTRKKILGKGSKAQVIIDNPPPVNIMLYKNAKYLCTLPILGRNIVFPSVTTVTVDTSEMKNGRVLLLSMEAEDGFRRNLDSESLHHIIMPVVPERSIGIYFIPDDSKDPEKLGVFSIDVKKNYTLSIVRKNINKTVIKISF